MLCLWVHQKAGCIVLPKTGQGSIVRQVLLVFVKNPFQTDDGVFDCRTR